MLGPEHPSTLTAMNNLSNTLIFEHRFADAEKLLRAALEIQRRVLGPEHPETVRSMVNLATSIVHQGRFDEAEKLEREALDIRRRVLMPNHPDTALSLYNLAILQVRRHKPEEALKFLREAVDHGLPARTILGIEKDQDFNPIHENEGFAALVKYGKEKVLRKRQSNFSQPLLAANDLSAADRARTIIVAWFFGGLFAINSLTLPTSVAQISWAFCPVVLRRKPLIVSNPNSLLLAMASTVPRDTTRSVASGRSTAMEASAAECENRPSGKPVARSSEIPLSSRSSPGVWPAFT